METSPPVIGYGWKGQKVWWDVEKGERGVHTSPMDHERFMRGALRQAILGMGATSPNPAVGAVIVRNGRVLARGFHRRAGMPHAEIEALHALKDRAQARGATLYVTLEPCSTQGRTPPCTQALLDAGIRRVVVGALDPNPLHAGAGLALLRSRGVEVIAGVLESECAHLNRAFFKWISTRRPWVIAKAAMSLDGRIQRPLEEGRWLTGPAARRDGHRLRAEVDAILVGARTVLTDDPALTVREVPMPKGKPQPWRVVVSHGRGALPGERRLFTDEHRERTLVYSGKTPAEILSDLGERLQVNSVLLEGGGGLLGSFWDARLVDEACFYLAPLLCGGPVLGVAGQGAASTSEAARICNPEYRKLGRDVRMRGLVRWD